jgi:hypothetical protein
MTVEGREKKIGGGTRASKKFCSGNSLQNVKLNRSPTQDVAPMLTDEAAARAECQWRSKPFTLPVPIDIGS